MVNEFLGDCWTVCDSKRRPCGVVYCVNRSQLVIDYSENGELEIIPFLSNLRQNIRDVKKYRKYHFFHEKDAYMDYLVQGLEQLLRETESAGTIPSFVKVLFDDSDKNDGFRLWFRDDDFDESVAQEPLYL